MGLARVGQRVPVSAPVGHWLYAAKGSLLILRFAQGHSVPGQSWESSCNACACPLTRMCSCRRVRECRHVHTHMCAHGYVRLCALSGVHMSGYVCIYSCVGVSYA